jgi:hypothetical protein
MKKESESGFLKIDQKLSWLNGIVKWFNGAFYVIEVKQSEDYKGRPKAREFELVIQGYIDAYDIQRLK